MSVRRAVLAYLLISHALLWATTEPPRAETCDLKNLAIGFGGLYRVGEWTSLRFELLAPTGMTVQYTVGVPDADDNLTLQTSDPIELQPGVARRVEMCFKTGRMIGDLEITIRNDAGVILQRKYRAGTDPAFFPEGLRLDVPFVALLGNPHGFDANLRLKVDNTEAVPSRFASLTPADLPEDWRGYQSLTALVLSVSTADLLTQIRPAQYDAMEMWVRMGGHLIIAAATETPALQASPLAKWMSVPLLGTTQVRQLDRLEVFSGHSAQLTHSGTVAAAQIGPVDRRSTVVETLSGPLLVRVPVAFGRITFLALDLNRPPLSTWSGLPAICEKLVYDQRGLTKQEKAERAQLARLGISDLASQLNAAQEDFGQRRVSYWGVLVLILCYLAVIGPVDYFLVHRWLKRPEWTWVTFPLLVVLGGGISVWGATRVNGREVVANVTDLVDIDAGSGLIRGHSWITPYSPETRRYAVKTDVAPLQTDTRGVSNVTGLNLAWSAIPENTVGGLYRPVGFSVSGRSYAYGDEPSSIGDLPLEQWSTKSLVASWRQDSQDLVESSLESNGPGRLNGSVAHHLPLPLEEFLLVYDGRAYLPQGRLKSLAPYQEWQPSGPQGQQRDLRSFLTGATATRVESKNKPKMQSEIQFHVEPYNPLHHVRTDLVRMLSFHNVSGGGSYTGLKHGALRNLELTSLMPLSRAFLVGRVKTPAIRLSIDGQSSQAGEHATYVRFLLPVKQVVEADVKFLPNPKDLK